MLRSGGEVWGWLLLAWMMGDCTAPALSCLHMPVMSLASPGPGVTS